jgi:tRNA(Arg) A34 adenosine deaminase TadA
MRKATRRKIVAQSGCGLVALVWPWNAVALGEGKKHFIAEAARMQRLAEANGDQSFGAVLIKDGSIVGYGPSRVIADRNADAHAERVALWDAQKRLGIDEMTGAVIYSTSRPCAACQDALAASNVERMYVGPDGADAGPPRRAR